MKFNNLIIKLLENFGNGGEIYSAMDLEDTDEMVRTADKAISKLNVMKDISSFNKKSMDKSKKLRDLGNGLYSSGKNREALVCYNKAIAYALPGTLEMLLAVGNRSAVLLTMRSLSCRSDINICLTMGSPPDLARKLKKRMLLAEAFVHEEVLREVTCANYFVASLFLTTELKRNADVNCASSDVAFINNGGLKQITAKRKISPGKVVAIEPAFVTSDHKGYGFLSCYYCNKLLLNPIPCQECCYAMFCSEECRSLCMSDYHSIECHIVDLLEMIYSDAKNVLTVRAAIKLSLKLGWGRFIAASENIGSSRMKVASTRETYSVEEPLSMLSYDDSQELVEGRMFNGSIICAIVLKHFDNVPNYFPKEGAKRAAAKKAMSKIIFHLHVHFTNTVCFTSSAFEHKSETYKPAVQTSLGWFSMSSKLKHSCQPNLLIVGLNDRIALLSLRTIQKGEELTISFMDHFLDYDLSRSNVTNFRASHLFLRTKKMCSCNVCTEEWSVSDLTFDPLTDRKADLLRRFESVRDIRLDKGDYQLLFQMLDAFSVKSKQYHKSYRILEQFLCLCQCKLSSNRCYFEE